MTLAAVTLLALVLLVATAQDAFEVMPLSRRVLRQLRFVSLFYRVTWRWWSALSARLPRDDQREHLLGVFGPLSMELLFGVWMAGLMRDRAGVAIAGAHDIHDGTANSRRNAGIV